MHNVYVQGRLYFSGQRFCVFCFKIFKICIPSLFSPLTQKFQNITRTEPLTLEITSPLFFDNWSTGNSVTQRKRHTYPITRPPVTWKMGMVKNPTQSKATHQIHVCSSMAFNMTDRQLLANYFNLLTFECTPNMLCRQCSLSLAGRHKNYDATSRPL